MVFFGEGCDEKCDTVVELEYRESVRTQWLRMKNLLRRWESQPEKRKGDNGYMCIEDDFECIS